jgi:hypothetical protein
VESLSSRKKDPWKKKGEREQGLKSKRGETSYEEAPCYEKKRESNLHAAGISFYQKKERKEIAFSCSAKSNVWPHSYPHIICIYTTFYSLIFPFLPPVTTPFSINHGYLPHKLSRIFLCIYNIQGVAEVPLKSEPLKKYEPRGKE